MKYRGCCHCGKVTFEAEGRLEQAIECNCSHCSRKGYLLWFVPRASFTLHSPPSALATYTFNKHVISHHFCPTCGCAPFGMGKGPNGEEMAAINIRCLEDLDLAGVPRVPFDGRSL